MTQHDLFRPMCGRPEGGQPSLFDDRGPTDSSLSCGECGRALTTTPSGYLACPAGHGRLIHDTDDRDASGSWFEPEYGDPVG